MSLLLTIVAVLIGISVLAIGTVAGRLLLRRISDRKLIARSKRIELMLKQARENDYEDLDKVLFDMRESIDIDLLDEEIRKELEDCDDEMSERLLRSVSALGLTDRYLDRVRNAKAWADRARAATILASIGDARAAEPLLAAMQDPREDRDVKLACAEALGRLKNPEVIPILTQGLANVDEWSSPRLASVLVGFGDQAVPALLETLDQGSSLNGRIWAAQTLGKIGSVGAVPSLLDHLHDRSEKLRLSVANALGDLGDARAIRPLVNLVLRDPSSAVRAQAATALGALGDEDAVPILVTALGDPEYWMRFRALEAIEVLKPTDTSPIEEALLDSNVEVRRRAALALERLGHLEASFENLESDNEATVARARARLIAVGRAGLSERFVRHLRDESDAVRENIAMVLGEVGAEQHGRALASLVEDDNEDVALAAIAALGTIGSADNAPKLVELLSARRETVRAAVANSLRRVGGKSLAGVLEALGEKLESESDRCRYHSTRVLEVIPGADADQLLLARATRDQYSEVRVVAVTALGQRQVTAAVDIIGDCLSDSYGPLRVAAANALSALGGQRAVDLLLAAMAQADREQRDAICAGIANLGFDQIGPALDFLLGFGDDNARVGAAWTLGKTLDRRAVPLLVALLEDSLARVRSAAAGALAKLPAEDSIEALRAALDDPNQYVRAAVVNALGRSGERSDLPALRETLADPDEYVRNRAAIAIGAIAGESAFAILEVETRECHPHVRALAFGLCGVPAAIGSAVEMLRDKQVRQRLVSVLNDEPADLKERFIANVRQTGTRSVDYWPGDDVAILLRPEDLVDGLVETLRNKQDPNARVGAIESLAQIEGAGVADAVRAALLFDPHPEVRLRAAEILAARPNDENASAMAESAKDPNSAVRAVALRALGQIGSQAHAAVVLAAVGADDSDVRSAAEDAAKSLFGDDPTEFVDWLMGRDRSDQTVSGLRVLAKIGDPKSVALLREFAGSQEAALRLEAVRALAAFDSHEASVAMLKGLFDPDQAIRSAIVESLPERPREEVAERLAELCRDPSAVVRAKLAAKLGKMKSAAAVELLEKLASDQSDEVQVAALRALLASPDPEGQRRFCASWDRLAPASRVKASGELGVLGDALFEQMRFSLDERRRRIAIRILALLDLRANAGRIAAALADPIAEIRLEALKALESADRSQLSDALRAVVDDPVAEVRTAARRLLIREV